MIYFQSKILILSCTLLLQGCVAKLIEEKGNSSPFSREHDNSIQRISVNSGYVVGGIIGIPLSLISLPVTIPMYLHDKKKNACAPPAFIIPLACSAYITGSITGIITWPFFGWYSFKDEKDKTTINESY